MPPSTIQRAIAAAELLLIAPAALFMTALVVRVLQPQQFEPAYSAQGIVQWYAVRPWTLWVLLIVLPSVVLAVGCATLVRGWRQDADLRGTAWQTLAAIRAHLATLVLAAATLAAAGILAIVAAHMLTD
jgi:hypothetical protein